jgi:hypothetical protein
MTAPIWIIIGSILLFGWAQYGMFRSLGDARWPAIKGAAMFTFLVSAFAAGLIIIGQMLTGSMQ